MSNEVLVVDDSLEAAEEYANLIQIKTQLKSFATNDINVALEKVRKDPIKVAVLDQRMPQRAGTALFKDIMAIDQRIKVIMLTGEAEAWEVGEAFKLGFVDYLHKSKVEMLPSLVLLQYAKYHVDFSKKHLLATPIRIYSGRKWIPLLSHISNYMVYIMEVVNENYIFDKKWVTIKQINTGESIKEVDKIIIENRFIHEESEKSSLSSHFSIYLPVIENLKSGIEATVSSTFKDSVYAAEKDYVEVVREYNLPPEPSNPNELHVVSRHYQRAPVYRQIRCLLVRECECCGIRQPFPMVVYQLTSKIATRLRDYLSDGQSRVILTGIENY